MCKVQNLSSIPKRKKRAINKRQPIHKRVRWIIHNLFQCFRVACTRHPHHRAPLGVIETLGGDRRTPRSSNSTDKIGSNYRSAHCLLLCFFSFFLFGEDLPAAFYTVQDNSIIKKSSTQNCVVFLFKKNICISMQLPRWIEVA